MNVHRKWPGTALSLVLKGDEAAARRLVPRARVGIGYLFDTMREGQQFRQMTLRGQDGSWMKLSAWRTAQGEKAKAEIFTPPLLGEDAFIYINGFLLYPQDVDGGIGKRFLEVAYENRDDALVLIKPLALEDKPKLTTGPVTWCSERLAGPDKNGVIISYDHGLSTRYRLWPSQDCSGRRYFIEGEPAYKNSGNPNIYLWGKEIGTAYSHKDEFGETVYSCLLNVVGAAVFEDWVVLVSHVDPDVNQITEEREVRAAANCKTASLFAAKVDLVKKQVGKFFFVKKYEVDLFLKAPWFFNPSGSEACCLYEEGSASSPSQKRITITLEKVNGELVANFSSDDLISKPFYLDILEDPETLWDENYNGTYVNEMEPVPSTNWQSKGLFWGDKYIGEDLEQAASDVMKDFFKVVFPDSKYPWPGFDYSDYYGYIFTYGFDGDTPPCIFGDCSRHEWGAPAISIGGVGSNIDGEPYIYPPGYWGNAESTQVIGILRRERFRGMKVKRAYRHKRGAEGKRYIALDYAPDGNLVEVTLELSDNGIDFSNSLYEEDSTLESFTDLTSPWTSTRTYKYELDYSAGGKVSWELKIDGETIFTLEGGFEGNYTRRFQRNISNSSGPCPMVTERGWLIDLDARYKIGAMEKIRYDLVGEEPVEFGVQLLASHASKKSILEVYLDGARIKKENDMGAGVHFFPWMSTAHLELLPRYYPVKELVEEFSFPSDMDAPYGNKAFRFWGIDEALLDLNPLIEKQGQIQCRFDDFIVSVTNPSTATMETMQGPVPYAPKEYIYRSYINDNPYDFVTECKKIKDFSEEFTVVPVSAL